MKLTSSCMAHLSSAVVCATSMRRSSSRNWRGRRGSCAHSRSSSTLSSSRQVRMNLKERWTGSWRGLCTCWKPPKVSHRWIDWFYFTKITFIVLPQMAMAWDSSDSSALSTFSRVGSLSSNGLSVHVLVYSSGIVQNELICGYASVVHTLSSLRAHTHACTHIHFRTIWGPQTDGTKSGHGRQFIWKNVRVCYKGDWGCFFVFFYLSSTMISAWPFKKKKIKFPVIPPVIFVGYSRITVDE